MPATAGGFRWMWGDAPAVAGPTLLAGLAVSAGLMLSATVAWAQGGEIGQIKSVSGQAFVLRAQARIPATAGAMLQEKDVVETGKDGKIGITFVDNTVFSAGPNSQVALEEFSFDSSNFKGSMLADMRQGTLSVVSGDITRSRPGALKIKTPTAILGVRGTSFVVQVVGGDAR